MSVFVKTQEIIQLSSHLFSIPNCLSASLIYCSANLFTLPEGEIERKIFEVRARHTNMPECHCPKDLLQQKTLKSFHL